MNTRPHHFLATNAQRREELLARCAEQRQAMRNDAYAMMSPSGNLKKRLNARVRLPLLVAGGILGLLMVRKNRLLPVLMAGASLWKSATTLAPVVRNVTARIGNGRSPSA